MAWLHKAMLVNLIIRGVINDELHSKRSKSRCGGVYTLRQQNLAGDYDLDKTQTALSKTQNITAYDGKTLVGVLRILTDGYFFWNHYRTSRPPGVPKTGESAADFYSLPKIIPQLCYILAHSQGWKRSMRKTAVKKACSPT